jgi:hypothetical protein
MTGSQGEVVFDDTDPEIDIVIEEDVGSAVWQVKKNCGPWSFKTGSLVREEDEFVVLAVEDKGETYNLCLPRGLCALVNVAEKEHEIAQTKKKSRGRR